MKSKSILKTEQNQTHFNAAVNVMGLCESK